MSAATIADWTLQVDGPRPYRLTLAEIEQQAVAEARIPVAAVEGWRRRRELARPATARRGRAGRRQRRLTRAGDLVRGRRYPASPRSSGRSSPSALLATHLNGERLSLDHGYPLRLMAPNRPDLLNTKWVTQIEVLS